MSKQVMREVHITPALNGFVVRVGCQTLVYTDLDTFSKDLKTYWKDPAKMEKFMSTNCVNPTLNTNMPVPTPVPMSVCQEEVDCNPNHTTIRMVGNRGHYGNSGECESQPSY